MLTELKMIEEYKEYYFKEKLSEQKEQIEVYLLKKGKFLIVSDTGTGKTYSIINSMKELAQIYNNKIFILLTPTKIQSMQNEIEYSIEGITSGKHITKSTTVASMVYNKIIELSKIEPFKEITLVVDEAHELVLSQNYKSDVLNKIDELSNLCSTVIHLTATPKSIKLAYEYDEKIYFKPYNKDLITNIETLKVVEAKNTKDINIYNELFPCIDNLMKKKENMFVYLNNKDKQEELKKQLNTKYNNEICYVINADTLEKGTDKEKEIYNSIIDKGIIPDYCKILLTSSIIESGTNIKNESCIPIIIIDNPTNTNFERIQQVFARPRKKQKEGIFIYSKPKTDNKDVLSLKSFYRKEKAEAIANVKKLNDTYEYLCYTFGKENAKPFIEALITAEVEGKNTFGKGYIYLNWNEEQPHLSEVVLNELMLINYCISRVDISYLNDVAIVKKELSERIKCNHIIKVSYTNTKDKNISDFNEKYKARKENKAEIKKQIKEELIEKIKDKYFKDTFKTYLLTDSDEMKLFKYSISLDHMELIEKLEIEKNILKDIKSYLNKYKMIGKETILEVLFNSDFNTDKIKESLYILLNHIKDFKQIEKIEVDYVLIRKIIRNTSDKEVNTRLTDDLFIKINREVYKSKTKKLTSRAKSKLMAEIELIYNLKGENIISSLKKK